MGCTERECVFWFGGVRSPFPAAQEPSIGAAQVHMAKQSVEAVMEIDREGQAGRHMVFVNRLIVFLFATDESFDKLMKLPKEPFHMSCGNQLCVSVKHISTGGSSSARS